MPASFAQRRARFRAILEGDRCVSPASVFDPMSARSAAEIGYETMMLAGSTAALAVLGAPDSCLLKAADRAGLEAVIEAFADRAYLRDGRLVPRSEPDALVVDAAEVAARAVRLATEHEVASVDGTIVTVAVRSLCLHGDTPGAVDLARAVLVTPGGVTRIVARLEERGLVRRVSATGRQAVLTRLTPRGEREIAAAMDVHFDGVRRMFVQYVDKADIDRLIELWARIREASSDSHHPVDPPQPET